MNPKKESLITTPMGITATSIFHNFNYHTNLTCVTIPFRNNGSWSGDGCSLVKTNGSHVVCTCNHLTNFAILINIKPQEVMWLWFKGAELQGSHSALTHTQNVTCRVMKKISNNFHQGALPMIIVLIW